MHDISLQTSVQTCDAIVRSLDGKSTSVKISLSFNVDYGKGQTSMTN